MRVALLFVLPLAACGPGTEPSGAAATPASADTTVEARAQAAGLAPEQARELAALGFPVLVPMWAGAFAVDSLAVHEEDDVIGITLRYRRPDSTCFSLATGLASADGGPLPEDAREVRIPSIARSVMLHQVAAADSSGAEAVRYGPGGLVTDRVDVDGLATFFRSTVREGPACRPMRPGGAAALVSGLRPLDPADDAPEAFALVPLRGEEGGVMDPLEGADPETLAHEAFVVEEGVDGVTVETVRRTPRRHVVLVTNRGLLDDSVRDEQIRAVFVRQSGGTWVLVQAAGRIRCREGRGHPEWGVEPCV